MGEFNSNESGFTIIELLIALGLGIFILSGVYLLFASQHQSYALQQATIQMQEAGRVAMHLLRDRLRQTGGLGCASWDGQLPVYIQARSLPEWLPQNASAVVQGFHSDGDYWQPSLPSYLSNHVRADTDVIVIHHAYEHAANLLQAMSTAQVPLMVPVHLNLQVGDTLMIADCEQADMLQISNLMREGDHWLVAHQPPYNISSSLSKAYSKEAEISVLQSAAYYIGDTGRHYANNEPIYALFQFTGQHQELIEGVSELQVQYGVDVNNDNSVDAIRTVPPEPGQGVLRSVIMVIETQSLMRKQKWYLTVALRN